MEGHTTTHAQRVLVTGAAGRLGSVVAARLHEAGHDVLATDLVEAPATAFRFEQADLRDHVRARSLLTDVDVVVHLGNRPGLGPCPPQEVFNDNLAINQNVFQGAAEQAVHRIIFASTLQLIGSHVDNRTVVTPPTRPSYPLSGNSKPDPSNVYALSKQLSETMLGYYVRRCRLHAVSLRLPLLHNGEDRLLVETGEETETDVFEGFTGLTHRDAAELVHVLVERQPIGYHVFMAGSSHRHRSLTMPALLERHYPEVPPQTSDLIDDTALIELTGWRPTVDPFALGPTQRVEDR